METTILSHNCMMYGPHSTIQLVTQPGSATNSAALKSACQGFGCCVERHDSLTYIGPHNIKLGKLTCYMSKVQDLARNGRFQKVGHPLEPDLHKITYFQ